MVVFMVCAALVAIVGAVAVTSAPRPIPIPVRAARRTPRH